MGGENGGGREAAGREEQRPEGERLPNPPAGCPSGHFRRRRSEPGDKPIAADSNASKTRVIVQVTEQGPVYVESTQT